MSKNVNKIITKPPNRGFLIRKPQPTTAEQDKALRDQLHIEIENKTKACSNPTYDCSIQRLEGHNFCIRHILQDPRAAYKQCAYTYPLNGKRCLQPAPKQDGKKDPGLTNYCFEHSRLAQLNKTRNTVGKYKQVESNESYLNDLTHHVQVDKTKSGSSKTGFSDADEEIDVVSPNVDPFINFVHVAEFDMVGKQESAKHRILDYASDSSSDEDPPTINNTWKGVDCDNSDNESIDSQDEDLLKHAGIYTTEEATMITKQKMLRLQNLYTEQVLRLQHILREKRRKYLHAIRKERETLCSIHDQVKDSPQERRLYEKLKALNHHHKRYGAEAILHRKYLEKRNKGEGFIHKTPSFPKCIYTEGGVKCAERTLPCCKFCKKHILEDKKQVLFRACGVEKSAVVCQEPVPNIFDDSTCVLHIKLPPVRTYTQKKYESGTEEEDEEIIKKEIKMEVDLPKDDTEPILSSDNQNPTQNEESQSPETVPLDDVDNNVTIVHSQQEIIEEKAEESETSPNDCEIIFEITTRDTDEE